MRYQAALRPDRVPPVSPRQRGFSANGSVAASRLARRAAGADTGAMMKVYAEQPEAMGKRVLVFSSIGHALMHMMTAFYAVIVLTLAISWDLPPERLLEFYAPSAVLLGIMSLPAGWASDRFGAPLMMVVMFFGLGLSSIACGLVPTGDTLLLMLALCGIVPGVLITLASWRAAFILPGIVCLLVGTVLAWEVRRGKVGDRPMPAAHSAQAGGRQFWRVFSVLSVTMALEG